MTSSRPPLDGATVLIEGASSGIGLELSRELAPRARMLVLVVRQAERNFLSGTMLEALRQIATSHHAR